LFDAIYVHFVHMDPKAIEWTKEQEDDADATWKAEDRLDLEVKLGREAALVVAVGPELHSSYSMYLHPFGRDVHMFLPGLFISDWQGVAPPGAACCLVFGRAEDAELKGLTLTATAMGIVSSRPGPVGLARLEVRGAPPGKGDGLYTKLHEASGRRARIAISPYTADAEKVRATIRSASLVLMPSHEEGFGLAGLEAISEGIPVLLSRRSGLAQAINQWLPELAPIHTVDTAAGPDTLASRIVERLTDRQSAFAEAGQLRDAMRSVFDWDASTEALVNAIKQLLGAGSSQPPPSDPQQGPPTTQAISTALENASSPLLNWPQTLHANDEWIDRPELDTIIDYIRSGGPQPLLLVGPPGSGKSALLARAGKLASAEGIAVLGIKADRIPSNVASVADLAEVLGLPRELATAMAAVAAIQPTVVLIDQLDALADLVDLRTSRLSTLLDLVTRLADSGVRLVMSSRLFELNHDVRLNKLKCSRLVLAPPTHEAIGAILQPYGVEQGLLSPGLRELLRTPQMLDAFIELRKAAGSWQVQEQRQLLALLWRSRLDSKANAGERGRMAERIAMLMADREELWLSKELLESQGLEQAAGELVQVGLLVEDGSQVSFAHQSLFEYARARAFVSAGQSLSDYVFTRQDALFIRPTLLAALEYLRAIDPTTYHREFEILWGSSRTRRHVRHLLWAFLGQRNNPTDREVAWVTAGLTEAHSRESGLAAIGSSEAWFGALHETVLPGLMVASDAHLTIGLVAGASRFAPNRVVQLLEHLWRKDPFKVNLAATALVLSDRWSAEMASLAVALVADGVLETTAVDRLVHTAIKAWPESASALVEAYLRGQLKSLQPELLPTRSSSSLEEAFERHKRSEPLRHLIEAAGGLHFVVDTAEAAPRPFLERVWPWFVEVMRLLTADDPARAEYADTIAVETSVRAIGGVRELPAAIHTALSRVAATDAAFVYDFVTRWEAESSLPVHRFLIEGLRLSLPASTQPAFNYLHADPRRLVVGDWGDPARDSLALIEAIRPHLSAEQVAVLEDDFSRAVCAIPGDASDVEERRWARDANRRHRLRLLLALGQDRVSTATRARVEQENRRFSSSEPVIAFQSGVVGSPVTTEQMLRARDKQILNLFDQLPDTTQWSHPSRPMEGGSIQASRAFAEAAIKNPARFLPLLRRFKPGVTERPVATAFRALGKVVSLEVLENEFHRLIEVGFFAGPFRDDAAWGLRDASNATSVMRLQTRQVLESWLADFSDERTDPKSVREHDGPLLFGMRGGGALPEGNFPILLTLTTAYLGSPEPAYAGWLSMLERHLDRRESPAVWLALAPHLGHVVSAGPERAQTFLERLFERFPRVRDSVDGLALIANAAQHLPGDIVARWTRDIEMGAWGRRYQAVGELCGLLVTRAVAPDWAAERTEQALAGFAAGDAQSHQFVLGLTYVSAHVWGVPARRSLANELLLRVAPQARGAIAEAIMGAFSGPRRLVWDEASRKLLRALRDNPLIPANHHGPWFVDRLQEALPAGADLVAEVAVAMVSEIAKSQRRNLLFSQGPDLVDIALTLQRFGSPIRERGMDLFELLLELNAYGVQDALAELEGRDPRRTSHRRRAS
jgi:hypothetical protein